MRGASRGMWELGQSEWVTRVVTAWGRVRQVRAGMGRSWVGMDDVLWG